MRVNLKIQRIKRLMSLKEAADAIGINRATYTQLERGEIQGSVTTWQKVQKAFGISDEDMWEVMQDEAKKGDAGAPRPE